MHSNSSSEDFEKNIIYKFHSALTLQIKTKNITVEQFFDLTPNQQTAPVYIFIEGLKKLGYTSDRQNEVDIIIKKYKSPFDSSVVNINIIISDIEKYKNTDEPMDIPTYDNLNKKITGGVPLGQSGLFSQRNNQIGSHSGTTIVNPRFEELRKRMIKEAKETKEYKLAEIYYQFHTTQSNAGKILNSLHNKFDEKDVAKNGYVTLNDFNDITYNLLILSEEQKKLLNEDIMPESNGLIMYKKFTDKVNSIDETELKKIIKNYDLKHNDYIIKMRNAVRDHNVKINDLWANSVKGKVSIYRDEFLNMIRTNNAIFKLDDDEIVYVFSIISRDGELLEFRSFDEAMKPPVAAMPRPSAGASILGAIKKDVSQIQNTIKEEPKEQNVAYNSSMIHNAESSNRQKKLYKNTSQIGNLLTPNPDMQQNNGGDTHDYSSNQMIGYNPNMQQSNIQQPQNNMMIPQLTIPPQNNMMTQSNMYQTNNNLMAQTNVQPQNNLMTQSQFPQQNTMTQPMQNTTNYEQDQFIGSAQLNPQGTMTNNNTTTNQLPVTNTNMITNQLPKDNNDNTTSEMYQSGMANAKSQLVHTNTITQQNPPQQSSLMNQPQTAPVNQIPLNTTSMSQFPQTTNTMNNNIQQPIVNNNVQPIVNNNVQPVVNNNVQPIVNNNVQPIMSNNNTQSEMYHSQLGQPKQEQVNNINTNIQQPQLPVEEKKDDFIPHQFYVIRSAERMNEIRNTNDENVKITIVRNRFDLTNIKLQEILNQHEKYIVYNLYYVITRTFQNWGQEPLKRFMQKDPEGKQKVTFFDFQSVLLSFGLNLPQNQLQLLLDSLKIKTNKLYSYDEFLKNVKNIAFMDNGQLSAITRQANLLFNDYINDFHHFIVDNKINYEAHYAKICKNMTIIPIEYFLKLCQSMNYILSHNEEYKLLYLNLCDDGKLLKQIVLFDVIQMKFTTEKEFIESGRMVIKNQIKSTNPNEWKKNIQKYTESTEKLYKTNFAHLTNVFQQINKMLSKNMINNAIDYFDDVTDNITPEGDIPIPLFEDKMKNIGIGSSLSYQSMVNTFKKPKSQIFKLAEFLSIYSIFFPVTTTQNANSPTQQFQQEQPIQPTQTQPLMSQPIQRQEPMIQTKTIELPPNNTGTVPQNNISGGSQIVFKNRRKQFTQKDIDEINEFFADMANLIIDEKQMKIPDFVRSLDRGKDGFITLNDFKQFIVDNYEMDFNTDHSMDNFIDFLLSDEIVGGEDVIHVDWLTENLLKNSNSAQPQPTQQQPQMSNNFNQSINLSQGPMGGNTVPLVGNASMNTQPINQQQPNLLQSVQNRGLKPGETRESKILCDFSKYLEAQKIRFVQIFPSALSQFPDQIIREFELKNGFKLANFPINNADVNLLLAYFDPITKDKVKVIQLKDEISKYAPTYFNQPYQNATSMQSKTQPSLQLAQTLTNTVALNGINKISSYLKQNKMNPTTFFQQSFKKNDINEPISKNEFLQSLTLIKDLKPDEGTEVFSIIDNDHDDKIIFNDLINYFGGDFQERKIANAKLNKSMVDQINELFNIFDTNKDELISKEDFLKAMKAVNHNTTMGDVEKIMAKINQGSSTNIDKKTFNEVMEKYIKEQLIIQEEEKDYILKLFREADVDKVGFLTPNQLKYLLTEKLNTNMTSEEINKIVQDANIKYDELIDIEEFVKLLDNVYEKEDDNLKNTVLEIKMQRRIHPRTFISLYNGLPLNFIPSFIREEQKLLRLLPSSMLVPKKDASGILYEDIKPVIQGTSNPNNTNNATTGKNYMQPIPTKVNTKISFDYATGVSSPDESLFTAPENKLKIVGRLLKIVLYNTNLNQYVSNAISIDAFYKKEYQDRWYFEEDRTKFNNNIIIRYNGNETDSVIVVFEFVLVIQRDSITTETSCGWCSCTMGDLYKPSEMKLQIKGGSPQKPDTISKTDVRTKRSGWGKFTSIFTGEVKSILPIKIKPFKELNNNDKHIIDYLPVNCIVHRASMQLIYIYRKIIGDYILNHQDYSFKVIKNDPYIMNSFCKIADCPDAFRIMTELWNEIVIEGATSAERKSEEYLTNNFKTFVNRIYSVIFADQFKYDELDPTKVPVGDIKLMEARNNLINSVIRYDKNAKVNKLNYGPVENLTSFKPFSIDEMKGEKISLVEKLDEMIPVLNQKAAN